MIIYETEGFAGSTHYFDGMGRYLGSGYEGFVPGTKHYVDAFGQNVGSSYETFGGRIFEDYTHRNDTSVLKDDVEWDTFFH